MPLFWLGLMIATPLWLMVGLMLILAFPSLHGKLAAFWTLLPLLALWLGRWRPRAATFVAGLATLGLIGFLAFYPWPRRGQSVSSSASFPTVLDLICNFVPESDLSELGVGLAYSGPTHERVIGLLRPLYAEMATDPEYAHLPHVVGSTAKDVFLHDPGSPHYYSYVPPGEGKKPALIFYHGAMGNFTVYLHFWRRWAQKRGWIVVCPSNGFGRWYEPEGDKRAVQLFDQALSDLPIDPQRVIVAGMSNGGTAVTRLLNARSDRIAAALLVCPVLEVGQTLSPGFLGWTRQHQPPIVLQGGDDVNVSPQVVRANVEAIVKAGGICELREFPGHDHHILFSDEIDVISAADQLAEGLTAVPRTGR